MSLLGTASLGCDMSCPDMALSPRKARIFVVVYSVVLHFMVFWVIARWGHGPSHHLGGSELQLLCERHVSKLCLLLLLTLLRIPGPEKGLPDMLVIS